MLVLTNKNLNPDLFVG